MEILSHKHILKLKKRVKNVQFMFALLNFLILLARFTLTKLKN